MSTQPCLTLFFLNSIHESFYPMFPSFSGFQTHVFFWFLTVFISTIQGLWISPLPEVHVFPLPSPTCLSFNMSFKFQFSGPFPEQESLTSVTRLTASIYAIGTTQLSYRLLVWFMIKASFPVACKLCIRRKYLLLLIIHSVFSTVPAMDQVVNEIIPCWLSQRQDTFVSKKVSALVYNQFYWGIIHIK